MIEGVGSGRMMRLLIYENEIGVVVSLEKACATRTMRFRLERNESDKCNVFF